MKYMKKMNDNNAPVAKLAMWEKPYTQENKTNLLRDSK